MGTYKGNINAIFYDFLLKEDGFSVGEKLTEIEKITKKRFLHLTEKEIYETMEQIIKTPVEIDEPFTDEEFAGFVEVILENGEKQTTFGVGRYYAK